MTSAPPATTDPDGPSSARVPPIALLLATVFLTGSAVMVVEIVGTRVLSPVFGVGLFVWSAQLAVTMGSLATGYFLGGTLADRRPSAAALYGTVLVAGLTVALGTFAAGTVLAAAVDLGLRTGTVVAGAILFGPPLVALGMAGPLTVRLANRAVDFTGRAAGRVYGVSTVGSLLATLVTGFWLVPSFDHRHILLATAAGLFVLAALGLKGGARMGALVALALPLAGWSRPPADLPAGVQVLATSESLHGRLQVIDDKNRFMRVLRSDRSLLGAIDFATGQSSFTYVYLLDALCFARPQAKDALQIGLGIGTAPMAFERRGLRCDSIEIDPEVARLAREYFGFEPRGDVFLEDARTFLQRTDRTYDLIVHDTFTGGAMPTHLLSLEVLETIHGLLRPGGALALNLVGYSDGPNAAASQMVARTLAEVFPHVRCFRDREIEDPTTELTNLVFLASDEPLDIVIPPGQEPDPNTRAALLMNLDALEVPLDVPPGDIALDRRNPLERLQLPVTEAFHGHMREMFPIEVWLN